MIEIEISRNTLFLIAAGLTAVNLCGVAVSVATYIKSKKQLASVIRGHSNEPN